jgi:hypothetical protein
MMAPFQRRIAMLRYAAVICFTFATSAHAQTVVINDNINLNVQPDGRHSFIVSKGVDDASGIGCGPAGCFTSFSMDYDGTSLVAQRLTLDEQSDWFLVEPGDVFSAATIAGGQFPILFDSNWPNTPLGGPLTVGAGEFYLGVRTGVGFGGSPGNPGPPNRNAYGWVHLRPENGVLTMVENVMSYNSRGIVVGTTTVVPEPASLEIVLFGVGMIAARRRRGRDPFRIAPSFNAVD